MSWVTNALVQQVAASAFRALLVAIGMWMAQKGFIAAGPGVEMFVGAGLAMFSAMWGMVNKATPK